MFHRQKGKIKSLCPSFLRKSHNLQSEKEGKSNSIHRLVLLLLLTFYSAGTVFRLANSPVIRSSDSDSDAIRTHISSNQGNLARNNKPSLALLPCSALINGETDESNPSSNEGFLCCDRSHHRTDICYMRGDIRTEPTSTVFLYGAQPGAGPEKVRPYTRKFEESIMNTIEEITISPIIAPSNESSDEACDVIHDVPAIVFSTGGYTGNLYHEFSDGLIPLYITSRRFGGEVVFVVLEYHKWWGVKYRRVLEQMTNYKIIDFSEDRRVHCFKEMIVGLKIHGELIIDPQLMPGGYGIKDFHALLHHGLGTIEPEIEPETELKHRLTEQEPKKHIELKKRTPLPLPLSSSVDCLNITSPNSTRPTPNPKIVIFIRKKTRVLQNVRDVVKICHRVGFSVQILNAKLGTPLATIHEALSGADAMLAVHGAAVTHFLLMRPGSILIQIVPLGLDWAAENFYGEPARRLGLEYMEYKVAPVESSLSRDYEPDSPVLVNPSVVTSQGWWEMKKIYMDKQNVKVDVKKFGKVLQEAHALAMRNRCIRRIRAGL